MGQEHFWLQASRRGYPILAQSWYANRYTEMPDTNGFNEIKHGMMVEAAGVEP